MQITALSFTVVVRINWINKLICLEQYDHDRQGINYKHKVECKLYFYSFASWTSIYFLQYFLFLSYTLFFLICPGCLLIVSLSLKFSLWFEFLQYPDFCLILLWSFNLVMLLFIFMLSFCISDFPSPWVHTLI